jgi:ribosomal protein S18 acetylase RimI-like enzyme/predicted nucleotidyltransferase
MPRVDRETIVDALREALEACPFVLAAWLGGSDATGRTDEWSDIDLMVLVDDDRVEDAFRVVHEALEALSPVAHRLRLPSDDVPYAQEFIRLRDADEAHFVDSVVLPRSAEDRFLEEERHGTPDVLFDRTGEVRPVPLDRARHARRLADRLAVLRERFPLFQTQVRRAVRRGRIAAAASAYAGLTLAPLVEILRMRHCPDRFDFGARYLDRDLPDDARAALEAIALPGSLAEVEACLDRARALYEEALPQLDDAGLRLRRPTAEDAEALARVHVATWQTAYRGIVADAFLDRMSLEKGTAMWTMLLESPSQPAFRVWLAEAHGAVVGFADGGASRDGDLGPKVGEIAAIDVRPEWWRRGIGDALLDRLAADLAASGFETLSLWVLEANDAARRFYEARGFSSDGTRRDVRIGRGEYPELRYRRAAAPGDSPSPASARARARRPRRSSPR